mmetsp:Transcript_27276/g.47069  ORF Transcript_27276/g.47069 Transcript_27276/m.47069 type:complete len:358 (-) Transcript_27276:74-1147(-)
MENPRQVTAASKRNCFVEVLDTSPRPMKRRNTYEFSSMNLLATQLSSCACIDSKPYPADCTSSSPCQLHSSAEPLIVGHLNPADENLNAGTDFLAMLPDDILLAIFEKSATAPAVFCLTAVCRRWRNIILQKPAIVRLCSTVDLSGFNLSRLAKHEGLFDAMLDIAGKNVLSFITPLSVSSAPSQKHNGRASSENVAIMNSLLHSVTSRCSSLVSLTSIVTSDAAFRQLAQSFPLLSEVSIQLCDSCTSSCLAYLAESPALTTLLVSGSVAWDPQFRLNLDQSLHLLRTACPNVTSIYVDLRVPSADGLSHLHYYAMHGRRKGVSYVRIHAPKGLLSCSAGICLQSKSVSNRSLSSL